MTVGSPDSVIRVRASPLWIFISAVPFFVGTLIAVLYTLTLKDENKAYSLLMLIPFIGQ